GRGSPGTAAPGVATNAPLWPALSRHVPLNVDAWVVAPMCTGEPLGAGTIVRPNPTDPSGLMNAVPTADAADSAPQRSSVPSRRYTPPSWVTFTVTTLQYGCNCQRKVPRGWAPATAGARMLSTRTETRTNG